MLFRSYLHNNTISKEEVFGLFRTIPLYIEMGKTEEGRIKRAERLDREGNETFAELREEFYKLKRWELPDKKFHEDACNI